MFHKKSTFTKKKKKKVPQDNFNISVLTSSIEKI